MIGVALKVRSGDLESLSQSNKPDSTRLYEVLECWINTMSADATWETIIAALEEPFLNHISTARKIQQFLSDPEVYAKYECKSDFVRR